MKLGRLANLVPALVLKSPLHRVMSGRYLLLTFTGRKSGRLITTPVAYLADRATIILTTDSAWWANLLTTPRVTVRLKGRVRQASAQVVRDTDEAVEGLAALVEAIPSYGKFAGVQRDQHGRANQDDARQAIEGGRVLIKLELDDPKRKGSDDDHSTQHARGGDDADDIGPPC